MNISTDKAAEWLLIGFIKHWRMAEVAEALGVAVASDEALAKLAHQCPFLPSSHWQYKRPVRAYVASEWPKLGRWLMDHESNPVRCLTVVPQLMRLSWSGTTKSGYLSAADKAQGSAARKDLSATDAGNRARYAQRKSHGRSAWNVCKA